MAATALAIVVQRNLFSVVVLGGIYSFLMATVLVALDAVDVAMTEASVGAGISTVLLLGALYLCGGMEAKPLHRPWWPLAVSLVIVGMLVYGTLGLPAFSDPAATIHLHVVPRYLNDALRETGVPNVVTAVLASYRGFDTLGETTVVLTAGIGVIVLLRVIYPGATGGGGEQRGAAGPLDADRRGRRMQDLIVPRFTAKLLIPFILLFAAYVQFHGDFSPGGGFQAGVIAAAAVIFYALIFGLPAARRLMPDGIVETMIALGVLIYAGVGFAGIVLGGNYLDYFVLGADPVSGQHRGIFWVEVGVAITVCGVMLKVYYVFAGRRRGAVAE